MLTRQHPTPRRGVLPGILYATIFEVGVIVAVIVALHLARSCG